MVSKLMQEDKGLAKIQTVCSEMDAIWRPTSCHDLGIDGQIEFLKPDRVVSTGHIVAIQSKSGPSWFEIEDENIVKFYPKQKHRDYWKRLNLPVLLILNHPERGMTIYARVKTQLAGDGPILVRKGNVFCAAARDDLLGVAREDMRPMPPSKVLDQLQAVTLQREQGRTISGIEFLLASTDTVSGYFELRMCRITSVFELVAHPYGIGIGSSDHDFVERNVMKCLAHNLTAPFMEEFERVWYELRMVPDIAVPLSPFGLDVLGHLWSNLESYVNMNAFSHLHIKDVASLARLISQTAQEESNRLDESWDRLGEHPM